MLFLVLALSAANLYAHGDLHERIENISQEIQEDNKNAQLYMTRGELYAQHENYQLALKDFKKVERLAGINTELHFNYAKSYFQIGKKEKALTHLNKILIEDKEHVKAWRLKGHCLSSQEKYSEAGIAFQKVISETSQTLPENYFEAAEMFEKSSPPNLPKAIIIIEQGIEDLGKVGSFEQKLVELYLATRNYEKAIDQLSKQIESRKRKEFLLYERGKIYALNNNNILAKKDFTKAIELVNQLPSRLKNTTATKQLTINITNCLNKLK